MLKKILVSSTLASMLLAGNLFACNAAQHNQKSVKSMHSSHAKHDAKAHKMHLVKKIVAAVSKTGLNKDQVSDVTDAVNKFKAVKQELKQSKMFPIDALKNDKFDTKAFMDAKSKMFNKKMGAVTELFESVYATLTPEQRKIFKQEFSAPIVEKMIKKGMAKGKRQGKGKSCK